MYVCHVYMQCMSIRNKKSLVDEIFYKILLQFANYELVNELKWT